jgi:hypothetical protein
MFTVIRGNWKVSLKEVKNGAVVIRAREGCGEGNEG